MSHYDTTSIINAVLINPSFTVAAQTDYPASNALEGLLSQTDSSGTGISWTADINNGPALVMNVVIDSPQEEGTGYRLSLVNVFVEDVLCG
jgi:hypothetical protein